MAYLHFLLTSKPLTAQSLLLTILMTKPFENIEGKGENAGNYLQCFQMLSFSELFGKGFKRFSSNFNFPSTQIS